MKFHIEPALSGESAGAFFLKRRQLMQTAAALAGAIALPGCSKKEDAVLPTAGPVAGATSPDMSAVAPRKFIPGPAWQGGVRGGKAVSLWPDAALNFDPPMAVGQGDYYGLANFYRGLAFYGPNAEPQLDMAEKMDISADGLTYTFTLKSGLKFHHGRVVTAQDFKWTLERSSSKALASWVQGFLGSVVGHAAFVAGTAKEITGIVAKDPLTLVLTLSKPDVTILGVLAIPPFYVLPREEVERLGDKFSQNPVGTGPYKLKSWDTGQRIVTMERFTEYQYEGDLPYLDEIQYGYEVSDDIAYLSVSKNEADLTLAVPPAVLTKIKTSPKELARFKQWDSFSINWWTLDLSQAPFNDIRVRQAVNYAFNKERTAALGFNPTGKFLPPGMLGFDKAQEAYPYNPDKARALLKEAKATNIKLVLPVFNADNARLMQLLQQDLKEVGITVTLEQNPQTPFDIGTKLSGKYRMWAMLWGMGLPDPSELVASLYGTGTSTNFNGYTNPAIDKLAATALSEPDRTKRGGMYSEIEKLLIQDAPYLFLGVGLQSTFTSAALENYLFEPVLRVYWDRLWKKAA
jgi:oligopeptide transport system substrate-binding protein